MTVTDTILESRGGRRIVERFTDDRLRRLWREVWASLPAGAHDDVYVALGDGDHMLLVCDVTPENRPSNYLGQAARIGAHLRLLIDYYNMDDYSDKWVRAIAAHEIAHIVTGHLGPARPEDNSLPADVVLAMVNSRDHQYLSGSVTQRTHEEEATALAASWGYPEPGATMRRKVRRAYSLAEWTRR